MAVPTIPENRINIRKLILYCRIVDIVPVGDDLHLAGIHTFRHTGCLPSCDYENFTDLSGGQRCFKNAITGDAARAKDGNFQRYFR